MKLSDKSITALIIITTALWVVINILGWTNNHMAGMYLGVVLMLLYMVLGVAKQGMVSKKLFLYPLLVWGVTWIFSFFLAEHYSIKFAGSLPSFSVFGLHPSFASIVFLYWIGGMLTLTLGFIYYKDEWMSDKDWDDFKAKIQKLKKEEGRATNG